MRFRIDTEIGLWGFISMELLTSLVDKRDNIDIGCQFGHVNSVADQPR